MKFRQNQAPVFARAQFGTCKIKQRERERMDQMAEASGSPDQSRAPEAKKTVPNFAEEFVAKDYSGKDAVGHGFRRANLGEPSIVYPNLKIEEAVELQILNGRAKDLDMTPNDWQRYGDLQNKAAGQPSKKITL